LKIELANFSLDLSNMDEIGSIKEVTVDLVFQDLKFRSQELGIPDPLHLDAKIYNTDKSFVLEGNLSGNIILRCSRCLENYKKSIDIDIEEEMKNEDIENLAKVQIDQILKNNIFLNIPIKPLCGEDCNGLCSECGQNLNEEECDCDPETVDPRLADLEKFFDDE